MAEGYKFLNLGPVAEAFLVGAAAAGVTKLTSEIGEILTLQAAHGTDPVLAALERAVKFSRWRAADVRSILATNGQAPVPCPAGQALVLTLPTVRIHDREIPHRRTRSGSLDHRQQLGELASGPTRRRHRNCVSALVQFANVAAQAGHAAALAPGRRAEDRAEVTTS